jgi:hypothetical protein
MMELATASKCNMVFREEMNEIIGSWKNAHLRAWLTYAVLAIALM